MIKRRPADGNTVPPDAVAHLLAWYAHSARDLPWRRQPEPYGVWVSEVMLQQTQVATVIPYWERWMRALPNPVALAAATEERVLKLWEGLGYYSRASNLKKAAEIIVRSHQGYFPRELTQVRSLPGIGDYTAGAVCSIAFNQPTPAVDGNVIRVLTRVHGIEGDPRSAAVRRNIGEMAQRWMNEALRKRATAFPCAALTQALMELGALICSPRAPKCEVCPLRVCCVAFRQDRTAELPEKAPRERAVLRRFVVLVLKRGARYLARQRPVGGVNARLWEFPNFEVAVSGEAALKKALEPYRALNPRRLMRFKHSITKYRITIEAFEARAARAGDAAGLEGVWLGRVALAKRAFASAHRKIARKLA